MKNSSILLFSFLCLSGCKVQTNEPASSGSYRSFREPSHYICPKVSSIQVDGVLSDDEWGSAEWTQLFQDIQGPDLPKPKYSTRAKMLWNDQYLFVAAEIEEPHVWAKITERDAVIFYDNDFEVFIDPDGDGHFYYELEVNALETAWDLLLTRPYRDFGYAIDHWDIHGLEVGVAVNGTLNNPQDIDQGWTVELAIPFSVLEECGGFNERPAPGAFWRINFSRVEWRTEIRDGAYVKEVNPETGKSYPEDNWVWSPQYHINMHMPEYWGYLIFEEGSTNKGKDWTLPEDEQIKWHLRNVYYLQSAYVDANHDFTDDLMKLGWPAESDGQPLPIPRLQVYAGGYVAALPSISIAGFWTINEKGLVSHIKKFDE